MRATAITRRLCSGRSRGRSRGRSSLGAVFGGISNIGAVNNGDIQVKRLEQIIEGELLVAYTDPEVLLSGLSGSLGSSLEPVLLQTTHVVLHALL
jgi:hypothetical protein